MEEFKIFISYAHKDDAYFRVFKEGIESHSKSSQNLKWKIWCDKEIPVGSLWHKVIQNEVQNCNTAILLVSANFLSSEYIETKEFLEFIERSEKDGFIFLPVLLSDCNFMQWENLAKRQFFYPQGKDYNLRELSNISYSHLCEFYKGVIEPNSYRETYHKNCVNAFEKAIFSGKRKPIDLISDFRQPASSIATVNLQDTKLETLSDENVIKILRHFNRQSQNRNLNEKELADAIDTRNKIIAAITNEFDNQLELNYKEVFSSVMFDRILGFQQIQKNDIDLVQKFRNNKAYNYQDRSLIVSGLTLSLLNHFDPNKIQLLIDIISDFEEETWQRAMVGLLLSLIRYNNRLSMFPEISRRLYELKTIPNIQQGIVFINKILQNKCYSHIGCINCANYKNKKDNFIQKFKMYFGNNITITKEDLADIQDSITKQDSIGIMIDTLFYPDKLNALANKLENNDSLTISLTDWFEYINLENYIKLHELNPFALNLKDELFSNAINWFYPFKADEKIYNSLVEGYPISIDLEISDFVSKITFADSFSDIEKVFLLSHTKEFSEDFLSLIIDITYLESMFKEENSALEKLYLKIIRDLYRFSQLSSQKQDHNSFDNTLRIYNKSLLEKITNEITKKKIDAQSLYEQEKYQKSIDLLKTIPTSQYDFVINSLFVKNYIFLKEDNKAIPYLDKVLDQLDKYTLNEKLAWYVRAGNLYSRLNNNEHYIEFINEEILIREQILEESLTIDELVEIRTEKVINLANAYSRLSVSINNNNLALYYAIRCLNAFFFIPNLDYNKLQESIESHKECLYKTFTPEFFIDNFKFLRTELEKEIDSWLFGKILVLNDLFSKIKDLNIYKTSKYYNAALIHFNSIYEIIQPYVQNTKETEHIENESRIFHFVKDGIHNKIELSFKDVLLYKTEAIFKTLTQKFIVFQLFLCNLFEDDNLSEDDMIDNVLLELLKWNLWDFNKLTLFNSLFYSLIDQGMYNEAKEILKKLEDTLKLLDKQPIEEQIRWIEIAYNLFIFLEDKEKQALYAIKYLNTIFLNPNFDNDQLQELIEPHRVNFYKTFTSEILIGNFKSITKGIEKEINSRLIDKIQELDDLYLRTDNIDTYKTSQNYEVALKHANTIYEENIYYVQNTKETEPDESESRIFHFVKDRIDNKINLSFNDILVHKAEGVLKSLSHHIVAIPTTELFFHNLLSEKKLSSDDIIDNVLLEVLKFNLWDYNKLTIWYNLYNSLIMQDKCKEAKETLKKLEDILELLDKQPIEDQIPWIDLAYNLYLKLENEEKLKELFYYVIKYLNNLCLTPNIEKSWLNQIIESMRKHWKEMFINQLDSLYENDNFNIFEHRVEKEINPSLFLKIKNLCVMQQALYAFDIFQNSNYYNAILEHASTIYNLILPVVQSVKKNEDEEYENIVCPFVSKTESYDVTLPINGVLELKENIVLTYLIIRVGQKARDQYLDAFFNNLLFNDYKPFSCETIVDEILSEFLTWHLRIKN